MNAPDLPILSVTSFERGAWTTRSVAPGESIQMPREGIVISVDYHDVPWIGDGEVRPGLTIGTVAT